MDFLMVGIRRETQLGWRKEGTRMDSERLEKKDTVEHMVR